MHVAYNNISSIGISLMGNFEETQPTQAQIDALTNLLTALAKKYNIDPTAQERYHQPTSTSPYITSKQLPTILGHGDIAPTACPGEHLHSLLPFIRAEVAKRLKGQTASEVVIRGEVAAPASSSSSSSTSSSSSASSSSPTVQSSADFSSKLKKIQATQPDLLKAVLQVVRERYQGTLPKATNAMNKLAYTYDE
jgi:hypothetical protein